MKWKAPRRRGIAFQCAAIFSHPSFDGDTVPKTKKIASQTFTLTTLRPRSRKYDRMLLVASVRIMENSGQQSPSIYQGLAASQSIVSIVDNLPCMDRMQHCQIDSPYSQ